MCTFKAQYQNIFGRFFYENEIGHVQETREIMKCKQTGGPWPRLLKSLGKGRLKYIIQ